MLALLKHHRNSRLTLIETSSIAVDKLIGHVYRTLPPLNPARSRLLGKDFEDSDIPITKATVRMMDMAMKEAEKLNSEYIEPEHLFLATLLCARGKLQKLLMKTFRMKK
jgi:ATP-dependent Clp protease ATP-binding subunit ClpA